MRTLARLVVCWQGLCLAHTRAHALPSTLHGCTCVVASISRAHCAHNTCACSHLQAQYLHTLTFTSATHARTDTACEDNAARAPARQNARKNNVSTHARIGKHKTRMRAQTRTTQAHTYVARIARTPHTCARVFANEHNKNARASLKCNTTCMPTTARLVARWQGLCLAQHLRARVSPPA